MKFSCFKKKKPIQLFVRHCHFSEVSQHKGRPKGFSRKRCYENLLETTDLDKVNITFFLDAYHPSKELHFVKQQTQFPVVEVKEGTETGSFLKLIDYVLSLDFSPHTIVYFLEDDYLHRKDWVSILLEGFEVEDASYVTLYDHRDKYFLSMYKDLRSKIYATSSCHWRTTPSTTNTYAMRFETLRREASIHRAFSEGKRITQDHEKFLELGRQGSFLISSIPGWSTHVEDTLISPCHDWGKYF